MGFLYDVDSFPAYHPFNNSAWNEECLNLEGFNTMRAPFRAWPGNNIEPSYSYQGDERSGHYSKDVGIVALSLIGFESFIWSSNQISILDYTGRKVNIVGNQTANRTLNLPDRDGTFSLIDDLSFEVPSPAPDGAATTFTLTQSAYKVLDVQVNGLGGRTDYTFTSGNDHIVMTSTLLITDILRILYLH